MQTFKAKKLPARLWNTRLWSRCINLNDLITCSISFVLNIKGYLYVCEICYFNAKIGIHKLRVRQSIPKRIQHLFIKIAVGSLSPNDIIIIHIRKILIAIVPGHIQSSCRCILSIQCLRHRCSHILTSRRTPHNCRKCILYRMNRVRII